MIHPSRYIVHYDAQALNSAPHAEKREMLGVVIDGMLNGEIIAGNTAQCLAEDITGIDANRTHEPVPFVTDTSHGQFSASLSLGLIRNTERLHGFINAIKRWPKQEGIIDVGSGTFPILALAAAVYHPTAEVRAIEINPESAEASETIIEAFGMSDRVKVINADIANYDIDPNTTAAVTETFNCALQEEPGPKIVKLLHENNVAIITPSRSELRLSLPDGTFTQNIDLRHDTHAEIAFDGWDNDDIDGLRIISLSAAYYDDFGLVLPYDTDSISSDLHFSASQILRNTMLRANSGRLIYELGAYPFAPKVKEPQLTSQ